MRCYRHVTSENMLCNMVYLIRCAIETILNLPLYISFLTVSHSEAALCVMVNGPKGLEQPLA
jgi:hypothetical protein